MIKVFEFETIRLRSQTAEALSSYLITHPASEKKKEILNVLLKTSDVIEHIAQYAIEDLPVYTRATCLISDLDTLLHLLGEYETELSCGFLCVPNMGLVNDLKSKIMSLI
ncbi:hypothetical protein RF657_17805 [Yersinia rochesterensis]|uniref:hypothetical protein n=1 Tax=Yersinia rochesterensis TaxID=1604335 RepID=UPI0028537052|nr:hypothetical protein [Yersinia rochesterensis]MDR5020226.1 hypothetical protein [Yersinia rochesterensis]